MKLSALRIVNLIVACAIFNFTDAFAQDRSNQDQFVGCLVGYIGAKYYNNPLSFEDAEKIAPQILKEVKLFCPKPSASMPDNVFEEDGVANNWMKNLAQQLLFSISRGQKILPK